MNEWRTYTVTIADAEGVILERRTIHAPATVGHCASGIDEGIDHGLESIGLDECPKCEKWIPARLMESTATETACPACAHRMRKEGDDEAS